MIHGNDNRQPQLDCVQSLNYRINRYLKEAQEYSEAKSVILSAANVLKYYATRGQNTTFSWELIELCKDYLPKVEALSSEISRENLKKATKVEKDFEQALSNLVGKYYKTSEYAAVVNRRLDCSGYSTIDEHAKDKMLIKKWETYKQLKIA